MEKTILYSKKSSCLNINFKQYETCQHQHCKQLLLHIKFLSNSLTQKIFKEQSNTIKNTIIDKENINDKKITNKNILANTLGQQIQTLKKNYTKLRKQLNQIEIENDQLYEENQNLKNKIEKLQQTINNNKEIFQLSLTKCNQHSALNSKNSFFTQNKSDIQNEQKSHYFSNEQFSKDFKLKFQQSNNQFRYLSTQRSEIVNKYEKLLQDYKSIQLESANNQQKMKQYEYLYKKFQYQNMQLKKIIKIRNQIQNSRHQVINNLKSVLDELEV